MEKDNFIVENRKFFRKKHNHIYRGEVEGEDYVVCRVKNKDGSICGEIFRTSMAQHLKRVHGITSEEAKNLYGIERVTPKNKNRKYSAEYYQKVTKEKENKRKKEKIEYIENVKRNNIEGYNFILCPECGKYTSDIKKHLYNIHEKTKKEIKEIMEKNITLLTRPAKYRKTLLDNFIMNMKRKGLTIVNGRLVKISNCKENKIKNEEEIKIKENNDFHKRAFDNTIKGLNEKRKNKKIEEKIKENEEFYGNIHKNLEERRKNKEKEEKKKIEENTYLKIANRQDDAEKRIEHLEKTIDMLRNIFSKISIDLEGINIKS